MTSHNGPRLTLLKKLYLSASSANRQLTYTVEKNENTETSLSTYAHLYQTCRVSVSTGIIFTIVLIFLNFNENYIQSTHQCHSSHCCVPYFLFIMHILLECVHTLSENNIFRKPERSSECIAFRSIRSRAFSSYIGSTLKISTNSSLGQRKRHIESMNDARYKSYLCTRGAEIY